MSSNGLWRNLCSAAILANLWHTFKHILDTLLVAS